MPKEMTYGVQKKDCVCQDCFGVLREDFLNYFALGNVIGKHVIPNYQDKVLVRDFDFDLFSEHY